MKLLCVRLDYNRLKYLFLLLLLWTFGNVEAQPSYPKGIYWSDQELKILSPSQSYDLIFEERSGSEMFLGSGNLYRLVDPDSSLSRKVLMADVWAYSDGHNLYLNGEKLDLGHWYVKVEHVGRYFLLKANVISPQNISNGPQPAGPMGVAYKFSAANYQLMAIEPTDFSVIHIKKKVLMDWLEKTPELLNEFKQSKDKNNVEVLLKYAILRNEIAASNAASHE